MSQNMSITSRDADLTYKANLIIWKRTVDAAKIISGCMYANLQTYNNVRESENHIAKRGSIAGDHYLQS